MKMLGNDANRLSRVLALAAALALTAPAARAQETPTTATQTQAQANDKFDLLDPLVVEKLDNGMTFLLYPNRRAPIVSGVIRYDVGGKDESPGMTGIAHMFEHMAFKGTRNLGTRDWEAERKALERVETAAIAYDAAQNRVLREGLTPEQAEPVLEPLEKAFREAQTAAGQYVVKNEFDEIYSREGGSDMNASTSSDATTYFISLPANRLPLWARMESARLSDPVMREFYSERDVVMEERRMRNDNSPVGRLWELMMSVAFIASPYGYPVIGYEADLRNLKANAAYEFFRTHYTPDRAVGVLVGDFDVEATRELLRETFGKIPSRRRDGNGHVITEPPQMGERRVKLELAAQPVLMMGWHKPTLPDPADVKADVLYQVLTGGRSARWFQTLVKERRLAADIGAFSAPGDALPNLFTVYANPQGEVTLDELEKAVREEVARLRREPVGQEELETARKVLKADTVRTLQSNLGLARALASSAQISGDPYYLERRLRQIEQVTPEDLQAFAQKYLVDENLTVARLEPPAQAGAENVNANGK